MMMKALVGLFSICTIWLAVGHQAVATIQIKEQQITPITQQLVSLPSQFETFSNSLN